MKSYYEKCVEWFDENSDGKDSIKVKIAREIKEKSRDLRDKSDWNNCWTQEMTECIETIFVISKQDINIDGFGIIIPYSEGVIYGYPFECFEVIK